MKTSTCSLNAGLYLVLLTATAVIIGTAGCAGDRYNRSTGEYIDDHSVKLRVDHALSENSDYKFEDVTVAVFKGNVQLNGFVDVPGQKTKAGDIVKQVQGVRGVENNITVENNNPRSAGETSDDKALASRVRDSLHNNPEYKFDDVAVVAYRGDIQLSGFVDTSDQKARAGDITKQIPGVKDVQDNITAKDKLTE